MKWWRVTKTAIKVGLRLGRVKEAERITQVVDGIDKVLEAATKPDAPPKGRRTMGGS